MAYLKRGFRGFRVRRLQKKLINLSYHCGRWRADGIFGPATDRALRKFQSEHKDKTGRALVVDGIYGPKTKWAISNPVQSSYRKPVPTPSPAAKRICVDAGHGGRDPGAVGHDGTKESTLNLRVAKAFEIVANKAGFSIIMTRHTNTYPTLQERARKANSNKCNLFVSFHHNSATTPEARGTEVYFWGSGQGRHSRTGKRLADDVYSYLLQNLHSEPRGIKEANFHVLRETKMTAILLEPGFLSNREELEFLKQANTADLIARATLYGIQKYYGLI